MIMDNLLNDFVSEMPPTYSKFVMDMANILMNGHLGIARENDDIYNFLVIVTKCKAGILAMDKFVSHQTTKGIEVMKKCPFEDENFIYFCNLITFATKELLEIAVKNDALPQRELPFQRLASREELTVGWNQKGFQFITFIWDDDFRCNIRRAEDSTFGNEFSAIVSVIKTHLEFIDDFAWNCNYDADENDVIGNRISL